MAQDTVESYKKAIQNHQMTFGKQGPIQVSLNKLGRGGGGVSAASKKDVNM